MRKVKILALLLAALMVVAAFAGCANKELEADVVDLDERVTALEGKVDSVGTKVDESNSSLQAILDQLNKLEQDLKDTNDKVNKPVDTTDLQKIADEYGAKIGRIQTEVTENKVHYLAADYVAIQEALAAAETEISAAGSSEAMATRYNALLKTLEDYVRVDTKFYNYYIELEGNYTGDDDCLDKVEVALDYYDDVVVEHYTDAKIDLDDYEYKTGEVDKKGNDVTVKLPTLRGEMEDWDAELVGIKDRAAQLVKDIDAIKPDDTYADLAVIYGRYVTWKKDAEKLSSEHVALVTNYDKLVAAQAASLNYSVASTLIANLKIDSALGDAQVGLFKDYTDLVGYGSHVLFVAVDGSGNMILDADGDPVMVADVYANIDNAIDKWIKENDITEDVAEYIINATFGAGSDYFYSTYLNAKAFAADMAAEFEYFKKELASEIKDLNGTRLSNTATLVAEYQANADAINDWYDEAVAEYKAACAAEDKADRLAVKSRAVKAAKLYTGDLVFADVFEANFNEMVALAGLGEYNKTDKTYYINGAKADEFDGGFVAADETADPNFNYILFYNFTDEETVDFLKGTYKVAKEFADAINDRIADFAYLQQTSVVKYLTTVGGYYGAPTTVDGVTTMKALEDSAIDVSGIVSVDDKGTTETTDDEVNFNLTKKNTITVAQFMKIFGKGGAAYLTGPSADLSCLINMDDEDGYNKMAEKVEQRIVAINDATSILNAAYETVFGTFDETIVTTAKAAEIDALVKAVNAWKTKGGSVEAEIATLVKDGEYELAKIVDSYDALKANKATLTLTKDGNTYKTSAFEHAIDKVETRLQNLVAEANILTTLYKALDKVNAYSTITYDKLVENKLKGNYAVTGITKGAANDDGEFKWSIATVDYDADKFAFSTKTFTVNASSSVKANEWNLDLSDINSVELSTLLANSNPTLEQINTALSSDKTFKVTELIQLATKLYDKFMVDNYGVKFNTVETARKTFAASENGYELKGWIVELIANYQANSGTYDISSLKTVTVLDDLTTNLNAVSAYMTPANKTALANAATFGGYTYAQLMANTDFNLSSVATVDDDLDATTPEVAVDPYAELKIVADASGAYEYDVPAYVAWSLEPMA